MKNYYKILELEFSADLSSIKKSYRRLALKYHPDKNKADDASQKFIEITEAYEVLNNKEKKLEYDKLSTSFFRNQNQKTKSTEPTSSEVTKEWKEYGEKKAEEYASMNYDDFVNRLIDELKVGISYTPNLIFIIFCIIGVITSFTVIANFSVGFGLFMLIFYSTICYFLYDRAKKDYIAERRNKILNKYK